MKPFAVILYDTDAVTGRHFVTHDHRREFYCIAQPAMAQATTRETRGSPAHIWWADTEQDALDLIALLSAHNPGTTWVKVKSCEVFSSVVEKYTTTKSKFTEKGLLPA